MSTNAGTDVELGAENRAQNHSEKLPPGPRDWAAYRLVKVRQQSTRAAARELGISQTRVCQLIERVVEYMTEVAPGDESPTARGRRLYIAESVAAERIDYLFGQVVAGYEKSIGQQTIVREVSDEIRPAKITRLVRHSDGDGRLAMAAAQLAKLGGKMPANTLLPELPDDLPDDDAVEAEHPPVEDCSSRASEQGVTTKPVQDKVTASSSAIDICELEAMADMMLNVLNSRPVQPLVPPTKHERLRSGKEQRTAFLSPG